MTGARLVETLEGVVWLLTPIAQSFVLASIFRAGLVRLFPIFIVFLTFDMCRSGVLWWLGRSPFTTAYRDIWIASEPVFLTLEFLVVLELYRLLYKAYPGIQSFARIVIGLSVLVAGVVSFSTISVDLGRIVWMIPDLQRLFLTKRIVCSVLGLLVTSTMVFFPRAPSARNVLLHGWLLAALLSISAMSFFAIDLGTDTEWMGTVFLVLQVCCFAFWAVGLKKPEPRRPLPTEEETRRVEKLNQELLAVGRWLVH